MPFELNVSTTGSQSDRGSDWSESAMSGNNEFKFASKTTVTHGSVSGTRWEYDPVGGNSSLPLVDYYFQHDGYSYQILVNGNGDNRFGTDWTALGDGIAKSLAFS